MAKSFIRASFFSTAAPILFANKLGGNLRLYVNYKAFNTITVKNKYPLPLIPKNLNRLIKVKYFTKLNIVAAFNKIKMVEKKVENRFPHPLWLFRIFGYEFRLVRNSIVFPELYQRYSSRTFKHILFGIHR